MITSEHLLLAEVIAALPNFRAQWESSSNLFRQADGSFTMCGVFAELSHYVRDNYGSMSIAEHRAIGELVNTCMMSAETKLDGAAATCFLENLAYERFSADFAQYLSGNAALFFTKFASTRA